jgi:hypothetical protein
MGHNVRDNRMVPAFFLGRVLPVHRVVMEAVF